jgi:hypothetical protein
MSTTLAATLALAIAIPTTIVILLLLLVTWHLARRRARRHASLSSIGAANICAVSPSPRSSNQIVVTREVSLFESSPASPGPTYWTPPPPPPPRRCHLPTADAARGGTNNFLQHRALEELERALGASAGMGEVGFKRCVYTMGRMGEEGTRTGEEWRDIARGVVLSPEAREFVEWGRVCGGWGDGGGGRETRDGERRGKGEIGRAI